MHIEKNPLILSGEYIRVFKCELEPGEVTAFGEIVKEIHRINDRRNSGWIEFTNASREDFHGDSTILIRTDSISNGE